MDFFFSFIGNVYDNGFKKLHTKLNFYLLVSWLAQALAPIEPASNDLFLTAEHRPTQKNTRFKLVFKQISKYGISSKTYSFPTFLRKRLLRAASRFCASRLCTCNFWNRIVAEEQTLLLYLHIYTHIYTHVIHWASGIIILTLSTGLVASW